jgi:hypothetical protein
VFLGHGIDGRPENELTPSNVSSRASLINRLLLSTLVMVELSLRTRRIAEKAARGPLKTAMTAA